MRASVVVPARDEAANLPRLLESLLRTDADEIIVVEGGSADGTRAIAESFAARDPRVRVIDEPPLPPGWVGKCWACWTGRQHARGEWLLFTDADTCHAPDSIAWAIEQTRGAELVTGLSLQELPTFAERVVMPPVFSLIRAAAGDPDDAALADPSRAIANGQFILMRADAYDRIGGHAAPEVRGTVVEDLALARHAAASGVRGRWVETAGAVRRGPSRVRRLFQDRGERGEIAPRVRVRMYRSVGDMWRGWRKNVAAGAARTPPLRFARTALTHALGLGALPVAIACALLGAPVAAAVFALAWLAMSVLVRATQRSCEGPGWWHALLHPIGYAFFGAVLAASVLDVVTGRGAEWKGRRYRS